MVLTCNFHVSARGNRFIADLAALYAAALGDLGVDTSILVDELPAGAPGAIDVVVGPQEWFVVGPALTDQQRLEVASRCVLLTTEQPGSSWWELQLPWARAALGVLDLSALGVEGFAAHGVEAVHAPVGYHRSLDAWQGGDGRRDIDACFLGGATERRLELLGGVASVLSHRRSRLLFHDPLVPVTDDSPWFVSGPDKAALLARSRILLNVHRSESTYFEWVRAIEAISNGALLLTEPAQGCEPLEPMAHFVAAEPGLFAAHVTALLADEPQRAKLAGAAYDFVRSELAMVDLLATEALPLLEAAAATPRAPLGFTAAPERPAPAGPAHQAPPQIEVPQDFQHRTLSSLKRLLIDQIELGRRLDRSDAERAGIAPDHLDERATPGWEAARPEISVVMPLHDYEETVLDAIGSALASRRVQVEVVVVDDHSTDRSRAVLEAFMDDHPEAPVLALFRATNAGPSVARNTGISRARTDLCFLLDADNLVRPDALWKLRAALDESGAAFAYSILEVFEGGQGLVSAMPWSPRSLAQRPYIDAMSLLRRQAWEAVGGFREPDDVLYGLEDYAFWLALAQEGHEGAWVPEPLGLYRRHGASRTSITGLDLHTPFNYLRREYPDLPWPR